ncbi:choice-of-anchor D domain-containing protein [Jiangella asiatica]|uniref:Choice-of-anchor D domain-containing protein n=1 Tax=Jiangella asiatica TaxID=2530372 RepID=A0A4R5CPP1_9ACTN|nr:choice-of-anchor D domain-containing protein [Jiangella asiatica]TDE02429.1 choice-of-anchor D domain-containing protein [Jiangella asiatica]
MDDPYRLARTRRGGVLALVALAMMSVLALSPGPAVGVVEPPGPEALTADPAADPAADGVADPVGGSVLGWDAAFFGPGLDGTVTAATVWDDGTGPALYVGGLFRTAGSQVVNQIARWDGTSWTPLAGPDGVGVSGSVYSLAVYDGDLIVGGSFSRAGGVRVNQIARWDGIRWSPLDGPAGAGVSHEREPAVLAMTVYDGALLVGGSFSHAGGVPVNHVARWDGTGWSPLQGETRPGVRHLNVPSAAAVTALAVYDGDLMVGGRFTEAGETQINGIARWDGLQWTAPAGAGTGLTGFGIPSVMSFAVLDGDLVAGGFFSGMGTVAAGNVVRWDGTTWSPLGAGFDNAANTLTVVDGALYAGGTFGTSGGTQVNRVAHWDGAAWAPLAGAGGTGVAAEFSAAVNGLVSYDGRLVVVGGFDTAGGTVANNLASWDGAAWTALAGLGSTGLSGGGPVIHDLVEYDGDIVAAGSFGAAGDAVASMIARWDGTTWAPLGGGIDGFAVNDLLVHDGVLVAAGNFSRAGDAGVRNLASWNGSTWSSLGGGVDREVRALAVLDGDLVAGGSFTEAGGVPANRIASWDGETWTPLGDGVDDRVRALTVHDGDLVVGGAFSQAGGVEVNKVARWDGAAWSPLGAGTSSQVDALAVYDGDIIASGGFLEAGGERVDRIARWDGEAWSPLDLGLNNSATELIEFQGDLIAAGSFVEAGRVRADRVARWDGTAWSALTGPAGNGTDGAVSALLARGDELTVGGSFSTSGGLPAWNLASYGPLDLVATPAEVEFGTVTIGASTEPTRVTLTNAGDDDIAVASVTAPDAPFEAAGGTCGAAPFTLAPGASCTLDYTFAPSVDGRATGTVTVTSDARTDWLPLTLTGTGTPPVPAADVTPDALSAEVVAGETGTDTVAIGNTGEAPLTWSVLGTDGAAAAGTGSVLHPAGPATVPDTVAGTDSPTGFGTDTEAGGGDAAAPAEPFAAPGDQVTLTHSASTEIVRDHSLACSGPLGTTDETAYLRTFTLADFGIVDDFDVSEVTFGVQRLNTTAPITVNLYTLDGELTYANLTRIGTATQELEFQAFTMVSVPVTGWAPAGSTLVVEIVAPTLSGTGAFYPGSNAAGETAPTYAAAAGCDTPEPTPVAELGSPDMHLVLAVTGGERPVCTLPEWLSATPAAGTTAPGATSEVTIGYDAAGLPAGEHAATLCVETDDPVRPLVAVPATLTVAEPAAFELAVEAERVRPFYYRTHLTWAGAPGDELDVYRDGELLATTANDGAYTDELGRVRAVTTFEYRLCVAGTDTCADPVEIEIDPKPGRLAVTTTALPPLNVLEAYGATLRASGGEAPYTWAATGLPPGLTLTPSSGLIGTDAAAPAVTDAAPATVAVTVTDARGSTATAELPLDVLGVENIAMGEEHTCALVEGGTAYCWGHNLSGQLGTGTSGEEPTVVPVRVLTDVTDLAAGSEHTCALHVDTTVSCWGFNGAGRLGTGDEVSSAQPRTVVASEAGGAPLTGVVDIVAGSTHTCALLSDGTARCWGYNYWGALGTGSIGQRTVPAAVVDPADTSRPFSGLTQLSAGSYHTCAVVEGGAAYCWGWNVAGQLGIGRANPGPTTLPSAVVAGASGEPLTGIAEIGAGNVHTCAVLADATAHCWGQNAYGQLGNAAAPANSSVPLPVVDGATGEPLAGIAGLGVGGLHSCAVTAAAGATCWGLNESGQLGDGRTADRDVAGTVLAADGEPFGAVAALASRQFQSCAVSVTGALSCWGANDRGQLGDGSTTDRTSPTPVRPASPGE